ncbi:hypothetical protein AAVH_18003 [Aphelenchoides avenae]|nr:hypothetical protein AAVH_18003 [Aphelenchus avenae]
MAEKVEKLSAVCRACGHLAAFTRRTVLTQQKVLIGGSEKYQVVCRACYSRFDVARKTEAQATKAAREPKEPPVLKRLNEEFVGDDRGPPSSKKPTTQAV